MTELTVLTDHFDSRSRSFPSSRSFPRSRSFPVVSGFSTFPSSSVQAGSHASLYVRLIGQRHTSAFDFDIDQSQSTVVCLGHQSTRSPVRAIYDYE